MRTTLLLGCAAALVLACGGAQTTVPQDPAPQATPAGQDPIAAGIAAGAAVDTIHDVQVADPFRVLESDSEITQEWINRQTETTEEALQSWARPGRAERLTSLLSIGVIGNVSLAGGKIFYTKREGEREQPALFVTTVGTTSTDPLIDPLTFGDRAALDWYYPSPSGRYVAFGISQNGDERSILRVIDVAAKRVLPDEIPHTKWCGVAWLNAEDGFYYSRYPREGEPNYDAATEDTYNVRVFFHALGGNPAEDALVFSPAEGTDFPGADVSEDDRWVVINNFRGWSASDVFLLDRGAGARQRIFAPDASHVLTPVVTGRDNLTTGIVRHGKLVLNTNIDAPRYRIATVAPDRAADLSAWRNLIPEGAAPIESWATSRDKIAIHVIDDVRSKVLLYGYDGRASGEIALPTPGSIDSLDADVGGRDFAFVFASYLHPPTLLCYDGQRGQVATVDAARTDFDFSQYEFETARVASADGTEIPLTFVHRRGMPRNGSQPVLLSGYGGFNVSLLPAFTRHALYWLERGGVYAVANLRGGSEFGETWHQAGNLLNKIKVFEDFEAAIRWFSTSGISQPGRIAITGGSNGGLLMGAMITRAPDAFGAAASYVGLYDMVRYHKFPPAEIWVSEYGSADDATQFPYLLSYSPYHHVEDGTRYPSILIETADHDGRVYWGHSTKFAARLEAANASDKPILFYMERQVGHGAGTRRSDLVDRYVRMYAFVEHALAVE